MEPLGAAVEVWKVRLDRPARPEWRGWLSAAERDRAAGFADAGERHRYVVAHAALRSVLGRLCGVAPEDVGFTTEESGRPCLRAGPDFNLSHSGDRALIAVAASGTRVGVDVERIRADLDHLELARRMYQPEEAARVRERGLAEYFRLWTAKEAYVKATGAGLAGLRGCLVTDSVTGCWVTETAEGSATVSSRSPSQGPWPVRWLDVAPGYAAALVTTAWTPAPRTG
ncbi:4'-phosphopantetheinyl transferase superfamily protein [Nonomuraea sp. SMC257]|uniref:4'-phosphopantetheinyl transferase superfamily protein n=1 Tax=Nonomuraea montanisoli TaxID=2741721 RepID=A0A7Y6IDT1_9ACTN|nr:4'-phosphopantetheinyl transferase superfamily protein [Nonomuraea montanisoli]NUW36311.1 4'-phosphopantetheinyl transferase superfamily protein [Nonomuraea montanisoli]